MFLRQKIQLLFLGGVFADSTASGRGDVNKIVDLL